MDPAILELTDRQIERRSIGAKEGEGDLRRLLHDITELTRDGDAVGTG
jgi:hypothetical protein